MSSSGHEDVLLRDDPARVSKSFAASLLNSVMHTRPPGPLPESFANIVKKSNKAGSSKQRSAGHDVVGVTAKKLTSLLTVVVTSEPKRHVKSSPVVVFKHPRKPPSKLAQKAILAAAAFANAVPAETSTMLTQDPVWNSPTGVMAVTDDPHGEVNKTSVQPEPIALYAGPAASTVPIQSSNSPIQISAAATATCKAWIAEANTPTGTTSNVLPSVNSNATGGHAGGGAPRKSMKVIKKQTTVAGPPVRAAVSKRMPVEKLPMIRYRLLQSLVKINKHRLTEKDVKKWDYLMDVQVAYFYLRHQHRMARNGMIDARVYCKMLKAQHDKIMTDITLPSIAQYWMMREVEEKQDRSDVASELATDRALAAGNNFNEAWEHLQEMNRFILQNDLGMMIEMTEEAYLGGEEQHWDLLLQVKDELALLNMWLEGVHSSEVNQRFFTLGPLDGLKRFPVSIHRKIHEMLTILWTHRMPYIQPVPVAEMAASLVSSVVDQLEEGHRCEMAVLDLCSGAGGPTPTIERLVNARRMASQAAGDSKTPPVQFVLSDLRPHVEAWRSLAGKSEHLDYIPRSVDAANVPADIISNQAGDGSVATRQIRILCLSFHHFDDRLARRVLRDTMEKADGFV
ncbi:MAG: hypothetical protein M1826_001767 [Phylliscum demangeonii]|nr:MAG: hypothetical protein M1826_001767 [Phylliscum demangeonii]